MDIDSNEDNNQSSGEDSIRVTQDMQMSIPMPGNEMRFNKKREPKSWTSRERERKKYIEVEEIIEKIEKEEIKQEKAR